MSSRDLECPWTVSLAFWIIVALCVSSFGSVAWRFYWAIRDGRMSVTGGLFVSGFEIGLATLVSLFVAAFFTEPGNNWARAAYTFLIPISYPTLKDQLSNTPILFGCIKIFLSISVMLLFLPRSASWFKAAKE